MQKKASFLIGTISMYFLLRLIIFPDLDNELIENHDDALIRTLLTYSGYLTQIKELKHGNYELRIPNNEIKTAIVFAGKEPFVIPVKIE